MKPLAITIAAATLTAALAVPAFAGNKYNNRYDDGLTRKQAVREVMRNFDRLDRNNNGVVSFREVRRAQNKGDGRHNASFDGIRFDRDGLEIRIGNTSRHDYAYGKGRRHYLINTGNFHKFDRNRDGRITHKEAKKTTNRRFDRADRNGDGYLNRREIRRANWYATSAGNDWDRRDYRDRDRKHRH
jgi:Ca2+-binding EF-hand superfamily protein